MIIETRAYARAGLLGNPSDGYFGKTISIIVRNFGAHVSLYQTPELRIEPQVEDSNTFRNIYDLIDVINAVGYYGGARLIKAAIKKFCEHCGKENLRLENRNFTVRYRSSIPRQLGLAGSSALITAMMRALTKFYKIDIPREILPDIVLAAEVEELGINAGLQDRVIQAYEGCVYMNFERKIMRKTGRGAYESLDPARLPKLYIAYKAELGEISGIVHHDLRARYEKKDPVVIESLEMIAELAEEGRNILINGNPRKISGLMDKNFDLRRRIMNISASNIDLVQTARKCGASAKFSGSGGAVIGVYEDDEMLTRLILEMKKINARVIKPYIV